MDPAVLPFSSPPFSGNPRSTLGFYDFDSFRYLVLVESYLAFCDWLISLSVMFPRFTYVLAYHYICLFVMSE